MDEATTRGPNTHYFEPHYFGTTYRVARTTDVDGVEHFWEVPLEVAAALATPAAPREPLDVEALAWESLIAEATAFEAWYGHGIQRLSVNAWVGISPLHGYYGGWSVEGDPLYDEWDESVMTTATGDDRQTVIADLIQVARNYRQRVDERNAELREDDELAPDRGTPE